MLTSSPSTSRSCRGSRSRVPSRIARLLFFSARLFLEAVARERPTLLVFEDLHFADPSLMDLVEFLASRVEDVPLLLV